jgi:hypothetical protein
MMTSSEVEAPDVRNFLRSPNALCLAGPPQPASSWHSVAPAMIRALRFRAAAGRRGIKNSFTTFI